MESIKFNKKIYSSDAIKKAIEEFKNLANFKVKDGNNYTEVIIDKINNEVKLVIKDEFANYVLGLMS